jgi:kynurenine formamidase
MMKWRTFTVLAILAVAILLFAKHRNVVAAPLTVNSILDLTHTAPPEEPKKSAKSFVPPEERGTRIEAPADYARGLWTVDQIPAERLVRPLAVIDVSRKTAHNPDYQLTVDDIAKWEDVHGHIPGGAVVLLRTGWGDRWNNPQAFRNADERGRLHFPGFSLEAAEFLVDARYVVGIGTDAMNVDAGSSSGLPVHQYCSRRSVYHLENVANLEVTPEAGATLVVAPAKFERGADAPTRLLAMLK